MMPTEESPESIEKSHRWHGVQCNNLAWSLCEKTDRSPAEDEEMLHAAHASVFHWSKVGTELNAALGWMLLGNVHASLGNGVLALRYAEQSFRFFSSRASEDWEMAFAHAVLAHAAYASGEQEKHLKHFLLAEKLGQALADAEDREIFRRTFNLIPRPSI